MAPNKRREVIKLLLMEHLPCARGDAVRGSERHSSLFHYIDQETKGPTVKFQGL